MEKAETPGVNFHLFRRQNSRQDAEWRGSPARWRRHAFVCVLVIAAADLSAFADIDSSPIIVFSKSADTKPYSAEWRSGAWTPSNGSAMSSVGSTSNWIVTANCPARYESACATLSADKKVNLLFHNGSSWSSPVTVCSNTGSATERTVSLAYENLSGDLLIAYWSNANNKIGYRTYDGSTLSGESLVEITSNTQLKYVALYPRPGSDQIIMLTIQNNSTLAATVWNGSSWSPSETLSSGLSWKDQEDMAIAFEGLSGRGLVIYTRNATYAPQYRIWNGSSWSAEASAPSFNAGCQWLRLAADPESNSILFGGIYTWGSSKTITLNVWNGSSWGSPVEVENNFPDADIRRFDVAYEKGTGKGLVVYQEGTQTSLRFRTWSGSAWSSEQVGTNIGHAPRFIQLRTGLNTGEIFIAASDESSDLELIRWNGSSMSSTQQLCELMAGLSTTEQFMMAMPAERGTSPTSIPYSNDFESVVGPEWNAPRRAMNATLSDFLGIHRISKLKLSLQTVPGETYSVSFDFYALDSWEGTDAAENYQYGPDWFNVHANNSQIFRHTFVHEWPAQGMTYPYPYDQIGHYGFAPGAKEGVYRKVQSYFTATTNTTVLSFFAEFNGAITGADPNGFDDESWGIDNISVEVARFRDVSAEKEFAVNNCSNEDLYGGGLHWADLDNDGDLDCIMSGDDARFMKNNSSGQSFSSAPFPFPDHRRQAALLDIDNDGDIDLWTPALFSYDNESCAENDGAGAFSHPGNLGFSSAANNEACAAADLNRDGYCDLVMFSQNGNWQILRQPGSVVVVSGSNSASNGMNDAGDVGNGDYCSCGDVNNDGFPDFFYHYSGGKLFLSNGDGTYERNNHGISVVTGETLKFGSAWADYDNDGDLDLFAARMSEACTGSLWRNDRNWSAQTGAFTNVTADSGFNLNTVIDYTGPDLLGTRSVAWGDYDNDGFLDLLIVGASGNHYLYRNLGNGTFSRASEGLVANGSFADGVFIDYDNDGDLDIALTRVGATAMLFENRTNNSNYLKVRIIGRGEGGSNVAAIGTRVDLCDSSGNVLLARRDVGATRGYAGSDPLWLHFGGVNPNNTYKLKVYFQSRPYADPLVISVKPANASTTIAGRTIPQMVTVNEPNKCKITQWREVRNAAN